MPEAPEVPEAKDPFERRVALTVAVIVVFMAVFANRNDNAKTEAIISTTHAANHWAHYQSKSVKEHAYEIERRVLDATPSEATRGVSGEFAAEVERYGREKREIKDKAEALEVSIAHQLAVNNRCDEAVLVLQLAAVMCSLAILAHWRMLWFLGIALGVGGVAIGGSSFAIQPGTPATAPATAAATTG